MAAYIPSRLPSSRRLRRFLGKAAFLTLAALLTGIIDGSSAWASHAPRTFYREPAEGKPGTVVRVRGENCDLDGRPMQFSEVTLQWGDAPEGLKTERYPIKADFSWAGDFVIPQDGTPGDAGFAQHCQAADMVVPSPEGQWFKILAGPPPILSVDKSKGPSGTPIAYSGKDCSTSQGKALDRAKVHLASKGSGTPIASVESSIDQSGAWEGSLTVPSSAADGDYELWARCESDDSKIASLETSRVSFTVANPSTPTQPPSGTSPSPGPTSRTTRGTTPTPAMTELPYTNGSSGEALETPTVGISKPPELGLASAQRSTPISSRLPYLIGLIVLLLGSGGAWWWWRKSRPPVEGNAS